MGEGVAATLLQRGRRGESFNGYTVRLQTAATAAARPVARKEKTSFALTSPPETVIVTPVITLGGSRTHPAERSSHTEGDPWRNAET